MKYFTGENIPIYGIISSSSVNFNCSLVVQLGSVSTETLGTAHSDVVFKHHFGAVAIDTHHFVDNLLVLMHYKLI